MKEILIFLLVIPLLNAKTQSEILSDKALKLMTTEHVYSAIPLLDKSLQLMKKKGEMQPLFKYAKVEVMLEQSVGYDADYIALCDILKRANKIQSFVFPEMIGGGTSVEKEKDVCTKFQNYSGQQMFDYGVKMMTRTKDGISTANSIEHAMPYFKQAEQKNFHDPELYKTLSLIFYDRKKYKKALKYAKLFFKTNDKKGLYEADIMRIFAMSKLQVDGFSKSNVKIALQNLKKSKLLGSKEASKLIDNLTKFLFNYNSSNTKTFRGFSKNDCYKISEYDVQQVCINGIKSYECYGLQDYGLKRLCQEGAKSNACYGLKNYAEQQICKKGIRSDACYNFSNYKRQRSCQTFTGSTEFWIIISRYGYNTFLY